MNDVRIALYHDPVTDDTTVRKVADAIAACEKLNASLRAVSYEVENVRQAS